VERPVVGVVVVDAERLAGLVHVPGVAVRPQRRWFAQILFEVPAPHLRHERLLRLVVPVDTGL